MYWYGNGYVTQQVKKIRGSMFMGYDYFCHDSRGWEGDVATEGCHIWQATALSGLWAPGTSGSLQNLNLQSGKAGHGGSCLSPQHLEGKGRMARISRSSLATKQISGKPWLHEILSQNKGTGQKIKKKKEGEKNCWERVGGGVRLGLLHLLFLGVLGWCDVRTPLL